ncbi:MAG: Uma2 family endonuclease [Armatimonadetes bacterium]|nr:Uma2 family endonuclease [Armatimonadota bacterium]
MLETAERFLARTDWEGYLHVLEAFKGGSTKVTYDRGRLELLSPSALHELIKRHLSQLIDAALFERDIDYRPGGSTTFRRHVLERGLEPDDCYFLTVLPRPEDYDPDTWPAPDLAVEIEVTPSALDRMDIYREIGVKEVWRYSADHQMTVHVLGSHGYRTQHPSELLPHLDPVELPRFVQLGIAQGPNVMLRAFRSWLADRP